MVFFEISFSQIARVYDTLFIYKIHEHDNFSSASVYDASPISTISKLKFSIPVMSDDTERVSVTSRTVPGLRVLPS